MVRLTTVLARVPAIKFRKGGLGGSSGAHPTTAAAQAAASAPTASSIDPVQDHPQTKSPRIAGIIKIPSGILMEGRKELQEPISLHIVLQKTDKRRFN